MGYTTDFKGSFKVTPPLKPEHVAYLRKFNETRRMKRYDHLAYGISDPVRVAAGIHEVGPDGGYFVAGSGFMGQDRDISVKDYNSPPMGQPGLWCQWKPSKDGTKIKWDEGEKFYDYIKWIQYLINHFLEPWGYELNGKVTWHGEDYNDMGTIIIHYNAVEIAKGHV